MNDARLEQVRDWAINCVALAPFADVGDFVALGHGALDVIDAYEALRTQLAESQGRETALREALEETSEQLERDFAIRCRCDFVTKLFAGIERCVGCRARDRIEAIARALSGEQANG